MVKSRYVFLKSPYVFARVSSENQARGIGGGEMMPRALPFYYRTPSPMREQPEPRESSTEATEQPGRVEPQPAVGGAQEPAEPRSW
jgi:hypothetical protein